MFYENYECEGQLSLFDQDPKPEKPFEECMNQPEYMTPEEEAEWMCQFMCPGPEEEV